MTNDWCAFQVLINNIYKNRYERTQKIVSLDYYENIYIYILLGIVRIQIKNSFTSFKSCN